MASELKTQAYLKTFPARLSKGDRKRSEIVQETISLIATQGTGKANLEGVASQLGIFRSQVVYYFKDQASLFDAVLSYISNVSQELLVRALEDAASPEARLEAIVRATFEWARREPDQVRARIAFYGFFSSGKAFRRAHGAIWGMALERIQDVVAEHRPRPRDAALVAEVILDLVTSNLIRYFTTDWGISLDQAQARTLAGARLLI
jgi:AcrR family transcriptional regulator